MTTSAIGLLAGDRATVNALTCTTAFHGGTNLRAALRADAGPIKAWLALQVTKLIRDVGASNTLHDAEEITDVCEAIIDEFPALTMEEIAYVFRQIKRGKMLPKLYGQLRMRQILEGFRIYEGQERAEMLERHHKVEDRFERSSGRTKRWEHISLTEEHLKQIGTWQQASQQVSQSSHSAASDGDT